MATWHHFERDGVSLACLDFGGDGPPVLILPGLGGHAGEWAETASWLTERARVLALDARGQGHSERLPDDISPEAHVADTAYVIEQLGIAPVILIGHSLGGQRAIMLAGEQPDLVRALVVVDSGPAQGDDETVDAVADYFDAWPKPFPTREAAIEHFGGPSLLAEMWADGLEERDGGLWPRWEAEVMNRTIREAFGRDYWEQWEAIRCPTLAVRAEVPQSEFEEMAARLSQMQIMGLDGAKHDLHLDRPDEWRRALTAFLESSD